MEPCRGGSKIAEKASVEFGSPSVFELRYAGRKIVEFFALKNNPDPTQDPEAKLQDAICDCHRARHDATDHATTEIVLRLDAARKQFGHEAMREIFPEYSALRAELSRIRMKISDSRKDRIKRVRFYSEIEKENLPKAMKLYERFLEVEIELKENFVKRILQNWGATFGWILAIIISIALWYYS